MPEMKTIEIDLDVNAAIERDRRSFQESANDILRRRLLGGREGGQGGGREGGREGAGEGGREGAGEGGREDGRAPARNGVDLESVEEPGERVTGRWSVELGGRRVSTSNLKSAYRTLLLLLEERHPDFLQAFSEERARARRFVARAPRDLYLNSPDLAKHHAKPLAGGWYFDTNLSTDQVARRARVAARLCGLKYGRDVRILNGLEEI